MSSDSDRLGVAAVGRFVPISDIGPARRRRPGIRDFTKRDLWNVAPRPPLLRLDVGRPDHLRPLGGIRLDDDNKLLWRIEGRLKTELRDPLAHVGLPGDLHDVRMHLADAGGRRAGWR